MAHKANGNGGKGRLSPQVYAKRKPQIRATMKMVKRGKGGLKKFAEQKLKKLLTP